MAATFEARPFGVALGAIAICALLVGLAFSLPSVALGGALFGLGTTLAAMFWAAHPHRFTVPLLTAGMTAAACAAIMIASPAGRRIRDQSMGYAAGLLISLALLIASGYAQAAGTGMLLAFPSILTSLIGLLIAARIGADHSCAKWQRLAAVSVGAATVAAAGAMVAAVAVGLVLAVYLVARPLRQRVLLRPRRPR
jgi:hypothetical protein